MRTTLTLDEDLAAALKKRARTTGRSFKEIVNEAIRLGLTTGASPAKQPEPFRVEPHACGFRTGVDIGRLNHLVDELALEDFGELTVHEPSESDVGESP